MKNRHLQNASRTLFAVLCLCTALNTTLAGTIHVDASKGNDRNDGSAERPMRNINAAIKKASPGDTIFIVPLAEPINQTIIITDRNGEEDNPIIIEGNNNTLIGSRVVEPSEWELVQPGLYRHPNLMKAFTKEGEAPPSNMVGRFFLIVDGQPSRMGRSSKGKRPDYPAPGTLAPLQWSLSKEDGSVHLALDPNDSLENHRIEVPVLMNGMQTRGSCSHWVIRNLKVKHFMNDGFNFHGQSRDFRIENCEATMCGDDGMSAHGDCHVEVDGFVARMNSTGICHIDESQSNNRNVLLEDNDSYNLYLLHNGSHHFASSKISKRGSGIRLGPGEKDLKISFEDCVLDWEGNADAGRPVRLRVQEGFEVRGLLE